MKNYLLKFQLCLICKLLILSVFFSCSAAKSAQISDTAVTTPNVYSENKVVFLDTSNLRLKDLKFIYDLEPDSISQINKLDPIGCVVRGVRIPELPDSSGKFSSTGMDVAVVLDIVSVGSESLTSLVVFYQRGVKPGQMLNFQDLLVFYEPEWDGVTPPYFRIRLLNVKAERNQRTHQLLQKVENLSGVLNGIIPHPVLPAVQTGIQAAKEIFGNSQNEVLLDFQVQFYSKSQIEGSLSKLTPLRKGEWIVLGRAKGDGSKFWEHKFRIDQRTGMIVNPDSSEIKIPYVLVSLFSADASVPKHIMDRSKVLIDQLASASERNNLDALFESTKVLSSSVKTYALERRFKKYGSYDDFKDIIDKINDSMKDAKELNEPKASIEELRTLIRLVNQVTGKNFSSADDICTWWEKNTDGEFVKINDKNYPLGIKYIHPKPSTNGQNIPSKN